MTLVETPPTTDRIDPRIQARHDDVSRSRKVRRRRWVVGLAALTLLLVGAWFLTRTALLDVDQVQVVGATHTSEDDVRATAGVSVGDQVLGIDAGAIRSRLAALPWVADATVHSSWRGDVVLEIRERVPAALLTNGEGQPVLVDAEGRVLTVATAPDPNLVAVQGVVAGAPGEFVADAGDALAVINAMTPGVRSRVATLVVGDGAQIQMQARPSGIVKFCGATEIEAKVRSLQAVFAQVDDRGLATLDVCVPDQPVVTRVPGTPPSGGPVG